MRVVIIIIAIAIIIIAFSGTGIPLVFTHYHSKSIQPNTTQLIGDDFINSDDNAFFISDDISLSSIVISLPDPGTTTVKVYSSSEKPTKRCKQLPQITIPELSGPSRYNYNYYGADSAIFLLPGSVLAYNVSVRNVSKIPKCPARLYIFNNVYMYMKYKNHESYYSVKMSDCFLTDGTAITTFFFFNIVEPSPYYVALDIAANVTVLSNVSVSRQFYNTTGLKLANECHNTLSSKNPSCEITTCSSFFCLQPHQYILVVPDNIVNITYSLTFAKFYGVQFIPGLVFNVMSFVFFLIVCFLCCCYKCH